MAAILQKNGGRVLKRLTVRPHCENKAGGKKALIKQNSEESGADGKIIFFIIFTPVNDFLASLFNVCLCE